MGSTHDTVTIRNPAKPRQPGTDRTDDAPTRKMVMTSTSPATADHAARTQPDYWMRAVSFAGLHRMLKAVASAPDGLRANEINDLVLERKIVLTQRDSVPAPTTLYHYRNTLCHLKALVRDGRRLLVNADDPDVLDLLREPAPPNTSRSLGDIARERFAALVLRNRDCRALFFDLFMPSSHADSVAGFRRTGNPVRWHRGGSDGAVTLRNRITGREQVLESPTSVAAVLYGLRYWARDELMLIDEYSPRADNGAIMFPVAQSEPEASDRTVREIVAFILSLRTPDEWTLFSVPDLVAQVGEARRQPIGVLFDAITWLLRNWPGYTVLVPTSRSLATITAISPQRENLELRRYYKADHGPYVSHFRVHRSVQPIPKEAMNECAIYPHN